MKKSPLRRLRALAAAGLLLAGAAWAQSPLPTEAPLAAVQAAYGRAVRPGEEADRYRDRFVAIVERVRRSHANEMDLDAFAAAALRVLQALPPGAGDPGDVFRRTVNTALGSLDQHSRYLDPRSQADERSAYGGSFGGIGIEIDASGGALRVAATIPNTPAARAGLQAGDVIVKIDDEPAAGLPLSEAVARMRGAPGSPVALHVRRAGLAQDFTLKITRDTIRREAVAWAMEGDVLVLKLANFLGPVSVTLARAIGEATAAGQPRAVVLDLRGNPGGLLREAVAVADLFLHDGDIVSVRGRTLSSQRTWKADPGELLAGIPLAVLVDGRSASASELVADALQEHGRATVIGQRSVGKGSVQTSYGLGEGQGAVRLTTSLYYGPAGRTLQQVGVVPDIEVSAPATARPGATGPAPREPRARVDGAACPAWKAADPILSCAMTYLQAGGTEAFLQRLQR
jgi:carboxyl-terminal processing protease